MKMYELLEKYMILEEMFEHGDIDEETLRDTLESIEGDIAEKAENIAYLIKNYEGDIMALKEEEKRLSGRRKALENNVTRLKQILEQAMLVTGQKKIKTSKFTFSIQKNPPSLNVIDESSIPKDFWIEQAPVLDKKAIIDRLKNGEQINGVELVQREGLRIR